MATPVRAVAEPLLQEKNFGASGNRKLLGFSALLLGFFAGVATFWSPVPSTRSGFEYQPAVEEPVTEMAASLPRGRGSLLPLSQAHAAPGVSPAHLPAAGSVSARASSSVRAGLVGSPSRGHGVVARASSVDLPAGEEYEVTQDRPLGISWVKCADGGIYAKAINPAADLRVKVGDKLLEVSASFGDEIWPAGNYGQAMYAIRTRAGQVYMKIQARGGDTKIFDMVENPDDMAYRSERAGGNVGLGTKELQRKNYARMKQLEKDREQGFYDALELFKGGKFEDAVIAFENVKGSEPPNYVDDSFARVSPVFKASSYNIACCYSKMNQEEAAIGALQDALGCGFDDYALIRSDPNLEFARQSRKFNPLIEQYDEPVINSEAFNAFKKLFR